MALKKDSVLLDQLQRPCALFITFESEEGYNRAVLYNDTIQLNEYLHFGKFLGQVINVKEASEPTDIIWENRNFSNSERNVKKLFSFTIVTILLCISFALIF